MPQPSITSRPSSQEGVSQPGGGGSSTTTTMTQTWLHKAAPNFVALGLKTLAIFSFLLESMIFACLTGKKCPLSIFLSRQFSQGWCGVKRKNHWICFLFLLVTTGLGFDTNATYLALDDYLSMLAKHFTLILLLSVKKCQKVEHVPLPWMQKREKRITAKIVKGIGITVLCCFGSL